MLDFAAGSGRHAFAAAGRGLRVLAVDRDAPSLARIGEAAGGATRPPSGADARVGTPIEVRVADLESGAWPFGAHERFDAVVVANYLFRPRFALLAALVAPGGRLIYETFARGNERYGRPSNPDYLLAPGELLERTRWAGLTVLGYESGTLERPSPAVVQRVCAVRTFDDGAPPVLG